MSWFKTKLKQLDAWIYRKFLRERHLAEIQARRFRNRTWLIRAEGRICIPAESAEGIRTIDLDSIRKRELESIWDEIWRGVEDPLPMTYFYHIRDEEHVVFRYFPLRPEPAGETQAD